MCSSDLEVDQAQDFSPYVQILTAFNAYLTNLGLAGTAPEDDSDGDSFSNLDEYLFGGNPANSEVTPITLHDTTTGTISVNVRINDPIYSFVAQRSTDLENWVSSELEIVDSDSSLGPNFKLRDIIYEGDAPRMFIRVASQTSN